MPRSTAAKARARADQLIDSLWDLTMVQDNFADESIPGNKLTNLADIPAGAGLIPAANLPGGSVPDATTEVKGIVELATTAEAEAGTDASRSVVPSGLMLKRQTNGTATEDALIAGNKNGVTRGDRAIDIALHRYGGAGSAGVASGDDSILIGYGNAKGSQSVVIGNGYSSVNNPAFTHSVAIGHFVQCGHHAVVIGAMSEGRYNDVVSVGYHNVVNNNGGIALGSGNVVSGTNAMALGAGAVTGANGAIAIGTGVINNSATSLKIGPTNAAAAVIDSTGLLTVGNLRINQTPTVGVKTGTHFVPMNFNGSVFNVLVSNV